jgi:hypothetical protein
LLRLYLLHLLPPLAWTPGTTIAPVHVEALVEGIALAAEKGHRRELSALRRTHDVATDLRVLESTPRRLRAQAVAAAAGDESDVCTARAAASLGRAASVFLRESVAAGAHHLNYSSAEAQRELGWTFPSAADMWPQIIERERQLLALRSGLLAKLRPLDVVPDGR